MQPNPRSLEQILAELSPVYAPQESLLRQRQADIPAQIQAEEQGLDAKKTNAYDDILGGARRRGVGFAGIPLADQAKYNATDYLPAVARLRQSGREQAQSLEEALLGINERKQTAALGMRQYEQQRYDQHMAQLRAEEEARQQRAAAQAQQGSLASLFGGGGAVQGGAAPAVPKTVTPELQKAYNDVQGRAQHNPVELLSDYVATYRSAQNGNPVDKYKLQFYAQLLQPMIPTWSQNPTLLKTINSYFKNYDGGSQGIIKGLLGSAKTGGVPATAVMSNRVSY